MNEQRLLIIKYIRALRSCIGLLDRIVPRTLCSADRLDAKELAAYLQDRGVDPKELRDRYAKFSRKKYKAVAASTRRLRAFYGAIGEFSDTRRQ